MPLVLVPLAFTADAKLLSQIDARSSAVKAKVDSINSVKGKTAVGLEEFGHPQPDWAERISQSNDVLREQILAQWTYLWDQQKPIRTWPAPADIGADFLRAIDRNQIKICLLVFGIVIKEFVVLSKTSSRIDAKDRCSLEVTVLTR